MTGDTTTNTDGGVMAAPDRSAAVYRLLPSLADHQQLDPNSWDLRRLMRWQRLGTDEERPVRFRTEWMGGTVLAQR